MKEIKIRDLIQAHKDRRVEALLEVNELYKVLDVEDKLSEEELCALNLAIGKLEKEISIRLAFIGELENLLF